MCSHSYEYSILVCVTVTALSFLKKALWERVDNIYEAALSSYLSFSIPVSASSRDEMAQLFFDEKTLKLFDYCYQRGAGMILWQICSHSNNKVSQSERNKL